MCGAFSPSQTPSQKLTMGNSDALISSISGGGSDLNTQLQGLLSGQANNPGITSEGGVSSGFNNFAATGGLSPTQTSALSDQASDAARSAYSTASAGANRNIAATGGYGNVGAIDASLGRQGANAGANAAVNSGASIAGLQTQNQLAGLTGGAGLYNTNTAQFQNLINSILQNQATTNAGLNSAISTKAGLANNPAAPSLVNNIQTVGQSVAGGLAGVPTG